MTTVLEERVADILEFETKIIIANWLSRVNDDPEIMSAPLTAEERSGHLPEMFSDIVTRLRNPLPIKTRALTSDAAHNHGCLRREQGYNPAMIVHESRMLQVSIFETLQTRAERLNTSELLLDIMTIADEIDSQLAQAMTGYIKEAHKDGEEIAA